MATNDVVSVRRLYDDYRSIWMSREYYACKLSRLRKVNFAYEVALAIGASGTVAGWYIWQVPAGRAIWTLYVGFVAILAILKPLLQLPKAIERYSKLYVGYSDLFYDVRSVVDEICENHGVLTESTKLTISRSQKRYKDLALQDDERPSRRLLTLAQTRVNANCAEFQTWFSELRQT